MARFSLSIRKFIQEASSDRYVIPEFQRDFTWKEKQIEKLFDSIFENYPLPKFFIWKAPAQISVFKFLTDLRIKANDVCHQTDAFSVCDGQQRLTSILIGVNGFGDKCLYFNLLPKNYGLIDNEEDSDNGISNDKDDMYPLNFSFIKNGKNQSKKGWECSVKVSDLYKLMEIDDNSYSLRRYIRELNEVKNQTQEIQDYIMDRVLVLKSQLTKTDYLDFEDITEYIGSDLDKAIEFFTRINDGGKKLSKNDLLFSIVSKFITQDENRVGNLKIDFSNLKNKYKSFRIESDFILRVCLYVAGDNVLFKTDNFTQAACNEIINNWEQIKISIENVLDELMNLGIQKLKSKNSIIPIIYHYYFKNKENDQVTNSEKYEILKYVIKSNYSKVFGDHGDTLLSNFKQKQTTKYRSGNNHFSCNDFQSNLPTGKRLSLTKESIEDNIWNKDMLAKPILILLYGEDYISGCYHVSKVINPHNDLRLLNVPEGDISQIREQLKSFSNMFLNENEEYTNGLLSKIGGNGLIAPHNFQSRDDLHGTNLRSSLDRRGDSYRRKLEDLLCK